MGQRPAVTILSLCLLIAVAPPGALAADSAHARAKSHKKKPVVSLSIPEFRVFIPEEMLRPSLDGAPLVEPQPPAKNPARAAAGQKGKGKQKKPIPEVAVPVSVDAAAVASTGSDSAKTARALAECHALLDKIDVDVSYLQPLHDGECGTPQPVLLKSFGKSHRITVNPPATIDCPMVAKLAAWLELKVEPAAEKQLGSRVVALANATSYACRRRNNSAAGPLSEHAYANALDVAEFRLEDGRSVVVAKNWGKTLRDLLSEKSSPAAKIKAPGWSPDVVVTADKLAEGLKVDPVALETPVVKGAKAKRRRRSGELADLASAPASSKEAIFLRLIHRGACELFGTVLGPEANDFHRDHLHLDLAFRRHSAYCE